MGAPVDITPELARIRERHRRFYLGLAEEASRGWRQDPTSWRATLGDEQANIRRALSSAVEDDDAVCALGLCAAMARYWSDLRLFEEAARWFGAALDLEWSDRPEAAADAYLARSELRWAEGRYQDAVGDADAARSLYEAAGNRAGVARAEAELGWDLFYAGDLAAAQAHLRAVLDERTQADPEVLINALRGSGWVAMELGDLRRAEEVFGEAIVLAEQHGDRRVVADTLAVAGNMFAKGGAPQAAEEARLRLLPVLEEMGDLDELCSTLLKLQPTMAAQGRADDAAEMLDRAVALGDGGRLGSATTIMLANHRAQLALAEGRRSEASRLAEVALAEAERSRRRAADDWWPIVEAAMLLAEAHYQESRRLEARQRVRQGAQATAAALAQSRGLDVARSLMRGAFVAFEHGDREVAEALALDAEETVAGWSDPASLAWVRARLGEIRGQPDVQLAEMDRALAAVGDEPSRARAELLWGTARGLLQHGRLAEARSRAEELLEAGALFDERLRLCAILLLAQVARLARQADELVDLNRRLVEGMAHHPLPWLECDVVEHLALSASETGNQQDVVELLASASAHRDRAGHRRGDREQMDIDDALSLARQSLTPAEFAQAWSRGTGKAIRTALLSAAGGHVS